jgi:very-short-patch-repair endonuclease
VLEEVTRGQAGLVTRRQAFECGLSDDAIHARVRSGRWQRVHRTVYATFSGPVPRLARLWAAVLAAGPGAMLSHESAAEVLGLTGRASDPIHVTVPAERRVDPLPGVVIHRRRAAGSMRHPAATPPRTRVEETVVDLTQTSPTLDRALGWVTNAVGSRLTTAARLIRVIEGRRRLRRRAALLDAVRDVAEGCQSVLELRYYRDVERAHTLPRGERQQRRDRWYDDVVYEDFAVQVELDGRRAHPDDGAFRDHRRDNAAVVSGRRVLRYGFADVVDRPCAVAREVGEVLRSAGWRGTVRPCRAESKERGGSPGPQAG